MYTSLNVETIIIGTIAATSAAATYIATNPFPSEIKAVAVPILGLISVTLGAFWYKKVNLP